MRHPRWRRSIEAMRVAVRTVFSFIVTLIAFCVLAHMLSDMLRGPSLVHRSSRIVVGMGILSCDCNALQSTSWPAMGVDPW